MPNEPYEIASIIIWTASETPLEMDGVPFFYQKEADAPYTGADGYRSVITGKGWLGLKLPEFPGWYGAHSIALSYPNGRDSDHQFDVVRNFDTPRIDGDWIMFPVSPTFATPYID